MLTLTRCLFFISAAAAFGDAVSPEQMAEYRSVFSEGVEETIWNVTRRPFFVYAIMEDPANATDYIVSTDKNVLIHLSSSNMSASTLLGTYGVPGYREGHGMAALIHTISSMVYIHSLDRIILADRLNHCLISLERRLLEISTYAGMCGSRGDVDGYRLDARLNIVRKLVYEPTHEQLYLTDRFVGKLKVLSLESEMIKTIYQSDGASFFGFTIPPEGTEQMFLLADNSVLQNSSTGFHEIVGNRLGPDNSLQDIVSITPTLHVVVDIFINSVLLLDTAASAFTILCRKNMIYSPERHILSCSLRENPFTVMLRQQALTFPLAYDFQMKIYTLPINCSSALGKLSGQDFDGSDKQQKYEGYACMTSAPKVSATTLSDGGQAHYIQVITGCELREKILDVESSLECAAVCVLDKQCEGFHFVKETKVCKKALATVDGSEKCFMKEENGFGKSKI